MYIEYWQLAIPVSMAITAYFTWKQAHAEGMAQGMLYVITDLAKKGVVNIARDPETDEIVVGRHDDENLEAELREEEYYDDDENYY